MRQQPLRRLSLLWLVFLLTGSLFTGCQIGTTEQATASSTPQDIVRPCSKPFFPVTQVMMLPQQPSSDSVYFLSGVHIYALNAGTGALRWCVHAGNAQSHLATYGSVAPLLPNPPPPPEGIMGIAVNQGTIFAGSENGYTYAFDAPTGKMVWRHLTWFGTTTAPTVLDGVVYVASDKLYALNARDGSQRWTAPSQDVIASSPLIVKHTIYLGSYDNHIYALDQTTGSKQWAYQTKGRVYVGPVVDQDRLFFGAGDDGPSVYAITTQGKLLWHNPMIISSSIAVSNGLLYVGTNTTLYALSTQDGTVRWSLPMNDPLTFLVSENILYVTSGSTGLYALNKADGTLRWHNPLRSMRAGETTLPILIKDRLYVGTIDVGVSPSKAMIHAIDKEQGTTYWQASVDWNISTLGVAAEQFLGESKRSSSLEKQMIFSI